MNKERLPRTSEAIMARAANRWEIEKAAAARARAERKTLFAITHINADGIRQLTFANQGRNHYETQEAAEAHLAAVLANNNHDSLKRLWGQAGFDSLEVRPVKCYHHGDAIGIYFDN